MTEYIPSDPAREIARQAAGYADPVDRARFVRRSCGNDLRLLEEVERLLNAQYGESDTVVQPERQGGAWPGEISLGRIGHYNLLHVIGEGGFGIVYLAEQEQPVRRRVALKVLKLGMDTREVIARFDAEQQALALMDHPNIAKVFDAGATETGRPYFVMEFVDGIRVTEYCDQNRLSTRERVELFRTVCQAVQHAHQKGVIHRDIKPSNILVTAQEGAPVPKIIDFGIAKATGGRLTDKTLFTQVEQFMGTPSYMSPEQAEMKGLDIDTRTDIYSLGVLLYELLTGRLPFDPESLRQAGLDEIRRIIRENEPNLPSMRLTSLSNPELTMVARQRRLEPPKLIASVKGDLDWIVMKALEKDRTRRYPTANALSMDLQRHLKNEPILARASTMAERLVKWARRRPAAAAIAGVVAASALACFILAAYALAQAHEARALADENRRRAVRLTVGQGARLMEAGEHAGALLYFSEALHLDAGHSGLEAVHRARISNVLRQIPKLVHLVGPTGESGEPASRPWTVPGDPAHFFNISGSGDIRRFDIESGKPVGPVFQPGRLGDGQIRIEASGNRLLKIGRNGTLELWDWGGREAMATTSVPKSAFLEDRNRRELDQAMAFEFSPDGRRVFMTDRSGIWMWAPDEGKGVVQVVQTSGESVGEIHFSHDGRYLSAPVGRKGTEVRVWNPRKWDEEPKEFIHNDSVSHMVYDNSNESLATGCNDGTARIWNLGTGKSRTAQPIRHQAGVVFIAFSPDGRLIATSSSDYTIGIWDATTGAPVTAAISVTRPARMLRFSDDGRHLVSLSTESARVWDVKTGEPTTPYLRTAGVASAIQFAQDGRLLVVVGDLIQVWDLARSQLKSIDSARGGALRTVDFSSDGTRVATTSLGNAAVIWNSDMTRVLGANILHSNRIESAWFTTDSKRIAVQAECPGLWDVSSAARISPTFTGPGVDAVRLSPDGSRVAVLEGGNMLSFWAAESKLLIGQKISIRSDSPRIVFSPDGRLFGLASSEGYFVWDAMTAKPTAAVASPIPWYGTPPLAFDSSSRFLLASQPAPKGELFRHDGHGFESGIVFAAFDARTGIPLISSNFWDSGVLAAFSPDGRRLASTTPTYSVRRFEKSELIELRDLAAPSHPIAVVSNLPAGLSHMRFDPRARRLAVAFLNGTTRVWNVDTGSPRTPAMRHDLDGDCELCFLGDGRFLATASAGGVIRIWDADSGEPMGPPIHTGHPIYEIRPSPDGRFLVTRYQYLTQIWEVMTPPDDRPASKWTELSQLLSQSRINAVGDLADFELVADPAGMQDTYAVLRQFRPNDFVASSSEVAGWKLSSGLPSPARDNGGLIRGQPESRVVRLGESVSLAVSVVGDCKIQWRLNGSPLPGANEPDLKLTNIARTQLGSYSAVISNSHGQVSSKAALVSLLPANPTICGQWDFDGGNLSATLGYDLTYLGGVSGPTAAETKFGATPDIGIADIGGQTAHVMGFPACSPLMGYVLRHDAEPNGRGNKLNQYTLIMDVLWLNPNDQRFSAVIQIDDPRNRNDSDLFVSWRNGIGGIGISERYDGDQRLEIGRWHRVAFAVDMDASPPVISKYIDGRKHSDQTEGNAELGRDRRFALLDTALLFTDENGETTPGFVNSIQLHRKRLSDEQIEALGGATAEGVPYLVPAR